MKSIDTNSFTSLSKEAFVELIFTKLTTIQ